jgi:hypothetical protein
VPGGSRSACLRAPNGSVRFPVRQSSCPNFHLPSQDSGHFRRWPLIGRLTDSPQATTQGLSVSMRQIMFKMDRHLIFKMTARTKRGDAGIAHADPRSRRSWGAVYS